MLNYDEALKALFRADDTPKCLSLVFPAVTITNENIEKETMVIEESLFSGTDIELGGCESSAFEITVFGIDSDLMAGKDFTVTMTIGGYTVALGTYKVDSCKRVNEFGRRRIIAYDKLTVTDRDVSAWYNSLTFDNSLTLKAFRESLLTHLGITYNEQTLPNDSMVVEKTIEPTQLLGRDVLKAICQLNAGFGRMKRDNTFSVVSLPLASSDVSETFSTDSEAVAEHQEYTASAITGIWIREDSSDVGGSVGTNDNVYTVQGNFLVYGKNASELETIATNILNAVKDRSYVPTVTDCNGRPWLECGDMYTASGISSYIFKRSISGIHALKDTLISTGNEKISEVIPQHTLYEQLKSKTLKIQKSVDLLSAEMTDLEESTYSLYEQTAESIALMVSKDEIIQQINLSTEGLLIDVSKVDIHGVVRFFSLDDYESGASFDGGLLYSSNYFTTDTDGALVLTDGEPTETGKGSKFDLTNGTLDLKNVFTQSGTEYTNHVYLGNGTALFQGSASYSWMGSASAKHVGQVFIEGGRIKITDFDSGTAGESIYISNEGISTTSGAESAANVIDIRSDIYEYQWDGTPRYSNALVLQSNRSPVAMRCKRGRAVINPHALQAVYDTEHPEKSNKFSFAVNDGYETDADGDPVYTSPLAGADAGDGVIMFGRCEMQPDGSGFTVGSLGNYVGLQFSNDKDNPYVKVQQSSGTGESYADLYCRNLYCDSIASEGISEIETTLDADGRITAIEWTFENNTTATAAVTYNNDGSIASVGDTVFTVAE